MNHAKDVWVKAGVQLCNRCPLNQEATVWMTDCLLKYSNAKFFGKIDMDNGVYLINPDFYENTQFLSYARNLFTQLCLKASSGPLYAQGKQKMLNG